jgi:hypothetical protein
MSAPCLFFVNDERAHAGYGGSVKNSALPVVQDGDDEG